MNICVRNINHFNIKIVGGKKMVMRKVLSCLLIIVFLTSAMSFSVSASNSSADVLNSLSEVDTNEHIVVSSVNYILDDFDDGEPPNDFFGSQGVWMHRGIVTANFDNTTYYGNNGSSLKLTYNVSSGGSSGGYWEQFTYDITDPNNPIYDMSDFDELRFKVKGDNSTGYTDRIYIEFIEDQKWDEKEKYPVNGITDEWQEIRVNLSSMTKVNWTRMRQVAIVLDNSHITRTTGTLYFDDLLFVDYDVNITTDDQFLDLISKRTFKYFWENANPTTGLVRDKASTHARSSVAAVGFELTAIGIGESRGWISRTEAASMTKKILQTLYNGKQGNESCGTMGYKGFYYHLLNSTTGERDYRVDQKNNIHGSELSSVDTALLLAGVLFAGEYFNGTDSTEIEIQNLSENIYRRVEWDWMLNPSNQLFYMAWKPENETDSSHTIPAPGGGNFSESQWNYYTDEIILINLLAIGAPTHPVNANTFYKWNRTRDNYGNYSFYKTWWGSLFTYFFANCWFDLKNKTDSHPTTPVNWWENSRKAALANRQFCRDNNASYPTYGPNSWGITACEGPSGYNGGNAKSYGAPPTGDTSGHWHDGTIPPYGAGSTIVFFSSDPSQNEAVHALKNYYYNYPKLWGLYGFRDAYNLNTSIPDDDWYAHEYVGIDQGALLLAIENYRSGLVWNTFMRNGYVRQAGRIFLCYT